MSAEKYKIVGRGGQDLPLRLTNRTFNYQEAYELACEWNRQHEFSMAVLEKVDDSEQLARSRDAGPPFAHSWED